MLNPEPVPYCGRFAPSPTGPLHFGSLVAALGSFLDARAAGGHWVLRMEDVDAPRCSPQAADHILRALEAFGLHWDGDVVWQSRRTSAYADALAHLVTGGHTFPCACTRRELADSALAADGAVIYPGTCRGGLAGGRTAKALRLRVPDQHLWFEDAVQGHVSCDLAREAGDFVLHRADGLFAYQLAVVVDDAAAGVTHVVRGADLLSSTPRQLILMQLLGIPRPQYAHLPVVVNAAGEKLSKQTLATAVDGTDPVPVLLAALDFLGQSPPDDLRHGTPQACLAWAQRHWQIERVPKVRSTRYGS